MWRLLDTVLTGAVLVMLYRTRGMFMSNQDKLNAVADQLDKAKGEIVGAIADLKAQVEAGEALDFSRLDASAQALDDVVADADPEPEPLPEPTPES
ncbi:hypothetical protein [Antrihabitans spumae]|uniref:Uncharacterized protein n=1 Tax=Antrihabitans spumae TaxID=3373370 RepID=A0ABW7KLG8_9NOCA